MLLQLLKALRRSLCFFCAGSPPPPPSPSTTASAGCTLADSLSIRTLNRCHWEPVFRRIALARSCRRPFPSPSLLHDASASVKSAGFASRSSANFNPSRRVAHSFERSRWQALARSAAQMVCSCCGDKGCCRCKVPVRQPTDFETVNKDKCLVA